MISDHYCTLLNKLRDALMKERRDMNTKIVCILADNFPDHLPQASLDFNERDTEREYLLETEEYDSGVEIDLSICDEEDEEME
ncbi:hypothetical protein TNCV_2541031 [Trichonephila clavipes]|nr:hypothetical protein TNCV_2541031 [Trichonephila clavipes]